MFKRYKKIILATLIILALIIAAALAWRLGNWGEKTEPENGASANVSPEVNVLDQIDLAKEVGGETESIPLLWTDNNDAENLIITSDRQYYDASSEVKVYFSVKNTTNQEQKTDIYFWFDNEDKYLSGIKNLQADKQSSLKIENCKLFENCKLKIENFDRKYVKEYDTGNYFNNIILAGKTNYYLATITSPKVSGQSEFFIEAFSDKGAYGHLDPYLSSGLVGYWSFNGPDIKNTADAAYDRSGSYATGTMSNMATSTRGVPGVSGQGLKFDGVDDIVDVTNNSNIDAGAGGWSVGVWVKYSSASNMRIISKRTGVSSPFSGYEIYSDTSGKLSFSVDDGVNTYLYVTSVSAYNDNKWHFALGVVDRSAAVIKIYVDAKDVSNKVVSISGYGSFSCNNNLKMGKFSPSTGQFYDSVIDEVRIYNRALSASEINDLYKTGAAKAKTNTAKTKAYTSGLVGYWSFNGPDIKNTANAAYDRSGSYATGTMYSMATSTRTIQGASGQGLSFNTSGYILGSSMPTTWTTLTFTAWFKVTDLSTERIIFQSSSAANGWGVAVLSGKMDWYTRGIADNSFTNISVSVNKLYFITITRNGGTAIATLYDATNGNRSSQTLNSLTSPNNGNGSFYIGRSDQVGYGYFSGMLDEIRVYNRVLSDSEIKDLYNLDAARMKTDTAETKAYGSGLVGNWTFNGPDISNNANAAYDRSGSFATGTMVSMATSTRYAQGISGQALSFDGVDDYVRIPNNILNLASDFTIGMWVKINSFALVSSTRRRLISLIGSDGSSLDLALYETNTFTYRKSAGSAVSMITNNTFSTNVWYYVTLIRSSGSYYFYVNNVSQSVSTGGITASCLTYSNIGEYYDGNTNYGYFFGLIDEVRVYNRALSADEIKSLYQLGVRKAKVRQ